MIFKNQVWLGQRGTGKNLYMHINIGDPSRMDIEDIILAESFFARCAGMLEDAKKCLLDNDYMKAKYPDIDS